VICSTRAARRLRSSASAYRADTGSATYQSDKVSGPTVGAETVDALEFLARVVSHIPHKGQVLQRYYGWYANRTRGIRRTAGPHQRPPVVEAEAVPAALSHLRRHAAPGGCPPRHLGVRHLRPRRSLVGLGLLGCTRVGSGPARAGSPTRTRGGHLRAPQSPPPAADRPDPQGPWTVHSARRTLGGPTEIPIPQP